MTSTGSAALTINAIPLTVTYTANGASSIYGNTLGGLTGTVSSLGLVNGESLATALAGTASWGTTAGATSNVGSYGITGSGLSSSTTNYIVSFQQAAANATALDITARALTRRVLIVCNGDALLRRQVGNAFACLLMCFTALSRGRL